jgi:hypothetical protein
VDAVDPQFHPVVEPKNGYVEGKKLTKIFFFIFFFFFFFADELIFKTSCNFHLLLQSILILFFWPLPIRQTYNCFQFVKPACPLS